MVMNEVNVILVTSLGREEDKILCLFTQDLVDLGGKGRGAQLGGDENELALTLISRHVTVNNDRLGHALVLGVPRVSDQVILEQAHDKVVSVSSTEHGKLSHDDTGLTTEPHMLVLRRQVSLSLDEHGSVLGLLLFFLGLSGSNGHIVGLLGGLGRLGLLLLLVLFQGSDLGDVSLLLGCEIGYVLSGLRRFLGHNSLGALLGGSRNGLMLSNFSKSSSLGIEGLLLTSLGGNNTRLLGSNSFLEPLLLSLSLLLVILGSLNVLLSLLVQLLRGFVLSLGLGEALGLLGSNRLSLSLFLSLLGLSRSELLSLGIGLICLLLRFSFLHAASKFLLGKALFLDSLLLGGSLGFDLLLTLSFLQ